MFSQRAKGTERKIYGLRAELTLPVNCLAHFSLINPNLLGYSSIECSFSKLSYKQSPWLLPIYFVMFNTDVT